VTPQLVRRPRSELGKRGEKHAPGASSLSPVTCHLQPVTPIYMKTRLPHNFYFRIKYLTVTRPVDKMCNTQPQPQQDQILNCQTPRPGQKRKTMFSPRIRKASRTHPENSATLSSPTEPQPIYIETKSLDNLYFRIKYLTVTRPVNKVYNTQPQPQQNQIHNCQTPTPGLEKKAVFSRLTPKTKRLPEPSEGGSLHQVLQRVPNVNPQDADRQHASRACNDPDQRLDLVDLRQQFLLLLLLVIGGFVQKDLVFFVTSEIGAINQKDQQKRYNCRPNDPDNGHVAHHGAHKRLGGMIPLGRGRHRSVRDCSQSDVRTGCNRRHGPMTETSQRLSRLLVPPVRKTWSGLGRQEGPSGNGY